MKALFDTMVHVHWHLRAGELPEKWQASWYDSAIDGTMYITEPLISEIYSQVAKKSGYPSARNCIMKIKALKGIEIFPKGEDDELAIQAACIRLTSENEKKRGQKKNTLSLVDAYVIAISKRTGCMLFTTDPGVRDSARHENCIVDYLPKDDLS